MQQKFLLYIDILGFSEMVTDADRIRSLYAVIDSLNAHKHDCFKTIVFSDTILVYSTLGPTDNENRNYLVWYAIEFAEDLHHRLVGTGVYFRAVLTFGEFDHYNLPNTECFFGKALVDAYYSEKKLPAIGLFIDDICQQHNKYFRTANFIPNRRFVYLTRSLERLNETSQGNLPVDPLYIDSSQDFPHILWDLRFLRDMSVQMRDHPAPSVRAKYLATWDLYHKRYTDIIDALRPENFEPDTICPSGDWDMYRVVFEKSLSESPLHIAG